MTEGRGGRGAGDKARPRVLTDGVRVFTLLQLAGTEHQVPGKLFDVVVGSSVRGVWMIGLNACWRIEVLDVFAGVLLSCVLFFGCKWSSGRYCNSVSQTPQFVVPRDSAS